MIKSSMQNSKAGHSKLTLYNGNANLLYYHSAIITELVKYRTLALVYSLNVATKIQQNTRRLFKHIVKSTCLRICHCHIVRVQWSFVHTTVG